MKWWGGWGGWIHNKYIAKINWYRTGWKKWTVWDIYKKHLNPSRNHLFSAYFKGNSRVFYGILNEMLDIYISKCKHKTRTHFFDLTFTHSSSGISHTKSQQRKTSAQRKRNRIDTPPRTRGCLIPYRSFVVVDSHLFYFPRYINTYIPRPKHGER